MLSDQEKQWIESAAKAASYKVKGWDGDMLMIGAREVGTHYWWTPMTDSDDAFELLVKLGIELRFDERDEECCMVFAQLTEAGVGATVMYVKGQNGDTKLGATRKVIVMCASQLDGL